MKRLLPALRLALQGIVLVVVTAVGVTTTWTCQFGTTANDVAFGVDVDSAGNIYVVGSTFGIFPGQSGSGVGTDAFIRKYDPTGSETWTRQFGPAVSVHVQGDIASAIDVAADSFGNVYVVGYVGGAFEGFDNDLTGMQDAFIRKYDGSGTELWTRQFGPQGSEASIRGVVVDAAGNQYVVGLTRNSLSGQTGPGLWDAFVRKYDGVGNVLWTRQFGADDYDWGRGIALGF